MFLGEHFSLSVTFAKVYNRVNDTDLFLYVLFCRENQEEKNLMYRNNKNKGKIVHAYQIGSDHPVLNQLIAQGQIKRLGDV